MYRVILVPLDGSPLAEEALAQARLLAKQGASRIVLVRVLSPGPSPALMALPYPGASLAAAAQTELLAGAMKEQEREARSYLQKVRRRLTRAGIEAEVWLETGEPAERILEVAQLAGADLVVMSTHGRSGLRRMIFGSVAEAVLRHAGIPVLLTRSQPQGEG